jgi:TatD DNase family protein
MAKEILKLGFHISVGGVSTFKNAEKLRTTLSTIPLDRMLLETDCPYLAPHPYRGQRNDPHFIPTIAENLAKIKGVTVEEVLEITTKNAKNLFKI